MRYFIPGSIPRISSPLEMRLSSFRHNHRGLTIPQYLLSVTWPGVIVERLVVADTIPYQYSIDCDSEYGFRYFNSPIK